MDGDADWQQPTNLSVEDGDQSCGTTAADVEDGKRPHEEHCIICLEIISERAVAVPCNHLSFDFLCLVSWLQEKAACPLCKAAVQEVQYDWRSSEDYKTYRVPKAEGANAGGPSDGPRRQSRRQNGRRQGERWTPQTQRTVTSREDPALEKRRRVYSDRQYALHVGANRMSNYRDFTSDIFASSPVLQSRARAFLRRELRVFSFLDTASAPRGGNREFLLEYIVAILRTNDLKAADGKAEDLLSDFLGRSNAQQLFHELGAWLRSPYVDLRQWDGAVRYLEQNVGSGRHGGSNDKSRVGSPVAA
ncbi:hypothetical protein KC332_g1937 [Hortaea werneckii]|nr:hypothetical protein KC358_g320 [Hortaea werneckii]OTA25688.1 hypothetical protein BTJ68_11129 [Hortaea werneckii EXF-2000]KAI6922466.1 hypothetical protein KC348_g9761 [Hortaea werneckii]KAI6931855.1 hypothetical protein KC341_g9347 [Hortaea werneckii]KAI6979967.1 hypothetical protein KC329_g9834 [Hortaea werneckii]